MEKKQADLKKWNGVSDKVSISICIRRARIVSAHPAAAAASQF